MGPGGQTSCNGPIRPKTTAQSEIDAISRLKEKHQEIDKKVHHDLKTAADVAVAAKLKSDIDADIVKFKNSLAALAAKVQNQPAP